MITFCAITFSLSADISYSYYMPLRSCLIFNFHDDLDRLSALCKNVPDYHNFEFIKWRSILDTLLSGVFDS